MSTEQQQQQIDQLLETVRQLTGTVGQVAASVQTLMTDHTARQQAAEAQQREQEQATQAAQMQAMLRQVATEAVQSVLNPTRQPARISSTAGQVQAGEAVADPMQLDLVRAEAQLEELAQHNDPTSMQRRFDLREKVRNMKQQLGMPI